MTGAGGSVAKKSEPMVKANTQWTRDQIHWLRERSERLGLRSAAAAARMVVQAAMEADAGRKEAQRA